LKWFAAALLVVGCGPVVEPQRDAATVDASLASDVADCVPDAREGGACYVAPDWCVDSCGTVFRCVHGQWTASDCTPR